MIGVKGEFMPDLRRTPRVPVSPEAHLRATVVLEGSSLISGGTFNTLEFPAKPKDLSLGGIGLTFSYPMNFSAPDFKTCKLSLRGKRPGPTDKAPEVTLTARLAYFDPSRGRMGLAFAPLSRLQADFIEKYLR